MTTYKLSAAPDQVIMDGNTVIPKGHRWWDDYEAWLAAGNTPEPADVPAEPAKATVADLQAQLASIQDQLAQMADPSATAEQAPTE
ncbi:hypothetical protein [Pseudomonas putida]